MDLKSLHARITGLAQTHDFSQWELNGTRIWPFVLYLIYREYSALNYTSWNVSLFERAVKEASKFYSLQKAQLADKANAAVVNRFTNAILLTSSTRRVKIAGSYYDRIMDPYYDALTKLGYNPATLEWTYDHEYRVPRHNPSCLIQNQLDLCVARAMLKKRKYDIAGFPGMAAVQKLILEMRKDADLPAMINRDWPVIQEIRQLFKKQLSKGAIQFAFYYPYYSLVSFGFSLACKEMGIKTTEIQHGVIDQYRLPYSAVGPIPENGYDLLPDFFWAWDDAFKKNLENRPVAKPGDDTVPYRGGNLWNRMWIEPEKNQNVFYAHYQKRIAENDAHNKSCPAILLTLTYGYFIPDWLPEVINDTASNLKWYVRFHHNTDPSDIRLMKEAFGDANVEYELSNEMPLPALLTMVDIHATIESGAVAEAEEFGKKSVIITETGAEKLKAYIDKGVARAALSKKRFWDCIEAVLKSEEAQVTKADSAVDSNAENVKRFLANQRG